MFSTVLRTTDHKTIIIPNGRIISSNIINFSKEGTRRIELVFCIDYKDDLKLAKEIILNLAGENKKILKEPKPFVGVGSLGENSVNLTARFWCASSDFSDVQFAMLESVKLAFDAQGISYHRRSSASAIRIKGKTSKFDLPVCAVFLGSLAFFVWYVVDWSYARILFGSIRQID